MKTKVVDIRDGLYERQLNCTGMVSDKRGGRYLGQQVHQQ